MLTRKKVKLWRFLKKNHAALFLALFGKNMALLNSKHLSTLIGPAFFENWNNSEFIFKTKQRFFWKKCKKWRFREVLHILYFLLCYCCCGCWLLQWLQIETWKKWGFYYGKLKLQMKWSNGSMATKLTLTEKNINQDYSHRFHKMNEWVTGGVVNVINGLRWQVTHHVFDVS